MDNVLRRRRWIVRRKLEGWRSIEVAAALRIGVRTVYRWWSLYRKYGWESLALKSIKPHSYWKTPQETVEVILKLRKEKHWGPCKIEGYLKNYGGEGVVAVGHNTIHRILIKAGLSNPIETPRKVWGKRRFERLYGNNLWQADFKMTDNDEWMVSYLDDHSRFVPGSEVHHNPTGEHAIHLLEDCVHQYGKPDQILTDQGTQFHPARGEASSTFTEFCTGNGIQHIVASIRRPSTIGKIEAFHKAYDSEAWMFQTHREFIKYWNYQRPHQGIGYLYPADIYFKHFRKGTYVGG